MNFLMRLALATAVILQASLAWAVGTVEFVAGNASITALSGAIRIPVRGEALKLGDMIATGKSGEIHLHMEDDGLIALRPHSRMKIEAYQARGVDSDHAELRLFSGSVRSIAGWIARNNPSHYIIHTPGADIRPENGCDHEPLVITDGPGAGTYDKVNCGSVLLASPGGDMEIKAGNTAYVGAGEQPMLLPSVPGEFRGEAHGRLLEESKAALEASRQKRYLETRRASERNGLDRNGKPRLGDFQDANQALAALEEILRAYERGDLLWIRNRLDPSLIGFQRFLDDMLAEATTCKQMSLHLLDTQVQAGPDVAIVQSNWEKRCILMPMFKPILITGHTNFFLHKGTQGWYLAQLGQRGSQPACSQQNGAISCTSGGGPLFSYLEQIARTYSGGGGVGASGVGGSLATLVANGPALSNCATLTAAAVPVAAAANIVLNDPDIAGAASALISIGNAQGEREAVTLVPSAPGSSQFVLPASQLTIANRLPATGNGVLEQQPAGGLCTPWTVSYFDPLAPSGPQDVFVVIGP